MPGEMDTTKGPDVAAPGIVITIEVALQEVIVTGVPFKVTVLPLCGGPKPEPTIITWVPAFPVVAETLAMQGADELEGLTVTLSKVAVVVAVVVPLVTARPIYTFCAMLTVWLAPS
jgi:hypothetical protein